MSDVYSLVCDVPFDAAGHCPGVVSSVVQSSFIGLPPLDAAGAASVIVAVLAVWGLAFVLRLAIRQLLNK